MLENNILIMFLICDNKKQIDIDNIIKNLTLKGNVVLLSCLNIINFPQDSVPKHYLEMDKEKIKISDRVLVYGEKNTNGYINLLLDYCSQLQKDISFGE